MDSKNQTEHQNIKQTYPICPNMSRRDRGCKCNSRRHSESSLSSLDGISLNIETEGPVSKSAQTHVRPAK